MTGRERRVPGSGLPCEALFYPPAPYTSQCRKLELRQKKSVHHSLKYRELCVKQSLASGKRAASHAHAEIPPPLHPAPVPLASLVRVILRVLPPPPSPLKRHHQNIDHSCNNIAKAMGGTLGASGVCVYVCVCVSVDISCAGTPCRKCRGPPIGGRYL